MGDTFILAVFAAGVSIYFICLRIMIALHLIVSKDRMEKRENGVPVPSKIGVHEVMEAISNQVR